MFLEIIILLSILLFAFYKWATLQYDIFEKRKVPHLKPVPYFGNMLKAVQGKQSFFDLVIDVYRKFDCRVCGIFDQRTPLFFIRDTVLIKDITVKEFDHFVNHRPFFGTEEDANETNFIGKSLFGLTNGKWKNMRSTLSPTFTGNKMKNMFQLLNQVAEDTFEKFRELPEVQNGIELDIKDYVSRFANDIIASTAFGVKVNSLHERDNEFFQMGKKFTNFTNLQNFINFLYGNMKPIIKFLNLPMFNKEASIYFRNLLFDTLKYRKENNVTRPDVINLLMEASGMKKSENDVLKKREWTEEDIVAQCLIFFFAGFETVSTLLSFAAFELMENPEIQEKLYQEIIEVSDSLNGETLSYEKLHSMKYLDMVVSETLRKWPPVVALDRICNKDFVYTENDGTRVEIKSGDSIWIPVAAIHRDPKYYPNPDKFDPERFSDEDKPKIDPFTYLSFGSGPRTCIANRFAILEAKVYLYYLLKEFRINLSPKTEIPVKLAAGFQLKPITGFWMKLVPRKYS